MSMSQKDLLEEVKPLTQDQKVALLGFLIGRLADDKKFQKELHDGVQSLSQIKFDDKGNPIIDLTTLN